MSPLYLLTCTPSAVADSTKVCCCSAAKAEAIREVLTPLTSAIPSICGWIILLLALYFLLKYVVTPLMDNWHELKVKKVNNTYEEKLANNKAVKEARITELENRISIEELKTSLAQKKLKAYEVFYDQVEFVVCPKGEKEELETSLVQKKLKAFEDFYDKVEFNVSLKNDNGREQVAENEDENAQAESANEQ